MDARVVKLWRRFSEFSAGLRKYFQWCVYSATLCGCNPAVTGVERSWTRPHGRFNGLGNGHDVTSAGWGCSCASRCAHARVFLSRLRVPRRTHEFVAVNGGMNGHWIDAGQRWADLPC